MNRPTGLYLLEDYESDAKPVLLTEGDFVSFAPKFSKSGKWLTYGGRKDTFLEHCTCLELYRRPVANLKEEKSETVIPVVRELQPEGGFNGFFGNQDNLAQRYALSSHHEVFTAENATHLLVYFVNIETKELTLLPNGTNK